jgi:hypothetical protein
MNTELLSFQSNMVTRTRHNVTLYVHCLSCCIDVHVHRIQDLFLKSRVVESPTTKCRKQETNETFAKFKIECQYRVRLEKK